MNDFGTPWASARSTAACTSASFQPMTASGATASMPNFTSKPRPDDFVCGFEFAPARLRTLVNGASKRYGEVEILLSEGHGSFLLIVAGDWARWTGPCAGAGSIPYGRPFQGLGPLRRTACGAVTIIENLMAAEKTN